MNLRELAAGVIMVGFKGTAYDDARELITRAPFGGFIMFAHNITSLEQIRTLNDALRELSDPPPLLAIDQEGGRVARFSDGIVELPPMMALGATGLPALAFDAGTQLGFDLRRAGFSVNFAPVLDLALQANNVVIGNRAFGSSPHLVSRLGRAFARGLSEQGMIAVAKHFPGHGATSIDSHVALPVLDEGVEVLRERDLLPFHEARADVPAIMAAHVIVRELDAERPASLAPSIVGDLLRRELGFEGVCFTDDMEMHAIAHGIGTVEGVAAAIAAGADCAIIGHDTELALRAVDHLVSRVEGGSISIDRLQDAHSRVMRLRRRASLPLPLDAIAPHPGIGREIARRAVTLLRGTAHADPTACNLLSFSAHGEALVREAPALVMRDGALPPGKRALVLTHRAHLDERQRNIVTALITERPDTIIVSTAEPYDLACFPGARHALACYGDGNVSLAGLADVLFSSRLAEGVLPVNL